MKNKFSIILFLCITLFLIVQHVSAQKETEKKITIESIIEDETGNPIAGAQIFSGNSFVKSRNDGSFTISVDPDADLIVEAEGYEDMRLPINTAQNSSKINLKPAALYYEDNRKVMLPFNRQVYRGDVVGAVSAVNTAEVTQYDYVRYGLGSLSGRTLGLIGTNNVRGLGAGVADASEAFGYGSGALIIVDGLPRGVEFLRNSEIESITVLKDANSAILYGSGAVDGVILVTTKRGEAFKKRADVNLNYGLDFSKGLPEFLNSADYMTYYNQARRNDGMLDAYSAETINNYQTGNKYRYPDVDYYSSDYIRPFKDRFDVNTEFSGGNRVARYYINAGWQSEGTFLNFGSGKDERNNLYNVKTNVDLKINDWIDTDVDAGILFYSFKRSMANFWNDALNIKPYEYTPLLPISMINPDDPEFIARKREIDGEYLVGGSNSYQTTPIGDVYLEGEFEQMYRNISFNNRINFDFGQWVNGLSLHTNISFDYLSTFNQQIVNTYSTYEPTWDPDEDKIISLKKYGTDANSGSLDVPTTNRGLRRMLGFYGVLSYDRTFEQIHHVTGTLLGYATQYQITGNLQGYKQAHLGLQLGYTYDKRYMIDFSSAYINSTKLAPGNRGGFSPTLGLAWVVSSEEFMSSVSSIDYLKLRASAGIIKSDAPIGGTGGFFYYDERYTTNGTFTWNNSRTRSGVVSSWPSNNSLTFVDRKDFNVGLEGWFFNKFLGLEANYFYSLYDGLVVRPTSEYPNFYGTTNNYVPYKNTNANQYQGIEVGLTFNKTLNDWSFLVGANILYSDTKLKKVDEIYANDYQYRQGRPIGNYFGLENDGFFQNESEINNPNTPYQLYSALKPGDLRYKDQNGDNVINSDDHVYLGRSTPPFYESLWLKVSYKNLTFFASGSGNAGGNGVTESNYYWIDGNKKYSKVVMGSWTPETSATATYPRLSTLANSNNNQRSDFWMYSSTYFTLDQMQLTYSLPESVSRRIFMKHLDVFLYASNIYRFAKNREIMELSYGSPGYRTFALGVKATF